MAKSKEFEVKKEVLPDGTEVATVVPKNKGDSKKSTSSNND